ncbi:MAG: translocation/assembly module TamB domain-containing protein [Acetobacteraceae bacterium]
MRRAAKWIGGIVLVLVALPVLLVLALNTPPGRSAVAWLTPRLTGDTVRLIGISGRFPDALRIERIALRDADGDYAVVEGAALDWSPLQLVHRRIVIDRLAAARVAAIRMPGGSSSSGGFVVPAPVTLRSLQVARLDVGAALAGKPVAVALDGSGELDSLTDFGGTLTVRPLEGEGRYAVTGTSRAGKLSARLTATEPPGGLVAGLADLPDLGAIRLDASLEGPLAAIATRLTLAAGPLHATVGGTLDLEHSAADLTVAAAAPAMQPRPDIAWQSVTVDAQVRGPFTAPDATGRVQIDGLTAAGVAIGRFAATIAGDTGRVRLDGELTGLRVPGPAPDLLAGEPLAVHADVQLAAPDRPVHVTLRHKLFTADADALTGARRSVEATLRLPDLSPFAALGQVPLDGGLSLTLHAASEGDTTTVTSEATIQVTGGQPQAKALVGETGHLSLAATLRGSDLTLSRLRFTGSATEMEASGRIADDAVDLAWSLAVSDLAAAASSLGGQLRANGRVTGKIGALALTADIDGNVAAHAMSSGALKVHVEAAGLPDSPSGRISAQGELLGAPINVEVGLRQVPAGLAVEIERATWQSLKAEGALEMPTATMIPTGSVRLAMTRLADLSPLLGRPVGGSLKASFQASPGPKLPVLDARVDVEGLQAAGIAGSVRATATGEPDALAVKLGAALPNLQGAPARLDAAGTVNATRQSLRLASMQAEWHQQTLRLLAPVQIGFADGVTIDRLRLGLRQAVIDVAGRAGATLDITASLRNLPADIAAAFAPAAAVDGTLQGDARITGTAARPTGQVRLSATGLRARTGPGRALPPAAVTARLDLNGGDAQIDTRLTAGRSTLTVTGRAPLATAGALNLKAGGRVDLTLLDPILAAGGRRVRGQVTLDSTITGTIAAPNIAGTVQLAGGEVQDYGTGVHLSDIALRVQGAGGSLRITQFSAKAGQGTLGGGGRIDVLQPGLPLDLTLTARNAQPLSSDLITAVIDADLTLRGEAFGQLTAGGKVHVRRAEIRIPERMPATIAVLPVRRPGARPAPPPSAPSVIALNLALDAPSQVFIRGRGVLAEFGGAMQLGGTAAAPLTTGGFDLRRGEVSLGGRSLDFSEGRISFNGGSITDPALHLVANSTGGGVTATLAIDGTAHDPKITLSSAPPLPQDEVLAHLLFGSGIGRLGALEVAQIASALATLTGAGGIGDPLDKVRQGLGLDRLTVSNGAGGSPALEAGRYIAPRVYLGAKQNTSGGTQASVQFDIAKGLKLEGTAGTGASSATGSAGASNGTSVGLTYQFEY